jgi:hypothetical protein
VLWVFLGYPRLFPSSPPRQNGFADSPNRVHFCPTNSFAFSSKLATQRGIATCTNIARISRVSARFSFFSLRLPQLPSPFLRN